MNKIVRSAASKKTKIPYQNPTLSSGILQDSFIHNGRLGNSIFSHEECFHGHPVSDEFAFHGGNLFGEADQKR